VNVFLGFTVDAAIESADDNDTPVGVTSVGNSHLNESDSEADVAGEFKRACFSLGVADERANCSDDRHEHGYAHALTSRHCRLQDRQRRSSTLKPFTTTPLV
jgi:hypothetical protein